MLKEANSVFIDITSLKHLEFSAGLDPLQDIISRFLPSQFRALKKLLVIL